MDDGSFSIESYSLRSKMPDTDNKPQGPLDVIGVGSSHCNQIPSFSVITVELRNIRGSFWDDEEKRTGIYNLFMKEDPSGEVRKRFPDGHSFLPFRALTESVDCLHPEPTKASQLSGQNTKLNTSNIVSSLKVHF